MFDDSSSLERNTLTECSGTWSCFINKSELNLPSCHLASTKNEGHNCEGLIEEMWFPEHISQQEIVSLANRWQV